MALSSVKKRLVMAMMIPIAGSLTSCNWQGLNSLPMPGTEGRGPGAYTVQAQLPDVANIQPNSRVRVGDVTVGNVTRIERQDWHALVTMKLNGDVDLPANTIASVGQTSLLGTLHIELAPPRNEPPAGRLHDGSLIPLDHNGSYPSTEQTLAAASMLLNGGGLGQIQDITTAYNAAFGGREDEVRSLIKQLDDFVGHLDAQKSDIVAAMESVNNLAGQFAADKPVIDRALKTIPQALEVLSAERDNLAETFNQLGRYGAVATDAVNKTKQQLVQELRDIAPVLRSLADAGPALTRSMSWLLTYPWPKETITNWFRGDAANISMIVDLTLSRLDTSLFTGTRWEGNLTELEMQWGRTIGQLPSPATAVNPLVAPYNLEQGP